jgi:hypothetical protein
MSSGEVRKIDSRSLEFWQTLTKKILKLVKQEDLDG